MSPALIEQGIVQFPRFIFKDPQVNDLIGQVQGVLFSILDGDAEEDRKAFGRFSDEDAV